MSETYRTTEEGKRALAIWLTGMNREVLTPAERKIATLLDTDMDCAQVALAMYRIDTRECKTIEEVRAVGLAKILERAA